MSLLSFSSEQKSEEKRERKVSKKSQEESKSVEQNFIKTELREVMD